MFNRQKVDPMKCFTIKLSDGKEATFIIENNIDSPSDLEFIFDEELFRFVDIKDNPFLINRDYIVWAKRGRKNRWWEYLINRIRRRKILNEFYNHDRNTRK